MCTCGLHRVLRFLNVVYGIVFLVFDAGTFEVVQLSTIVTGVSLSWADAVMGIAASAINA